jgi:hypothetical protein
LSYGPRYFADIIPILSLFLYPVYEASRRRKSLKFFLGVFAVISIGIHGIGAFAFDGTWDTVLVKNANVDRFWSWTDNPVFYYGKRAVSRVTAKTMGKILPIKRVVLGLPGSVETSKDLSASYEVQGVEEYVDAFESFTISVKVTNTGKTVWLAHTEDNRGEIRFGWRWFRDDREIINATGRHPLERDVFPGEHHLFKVRMWPPLRGGMYTLFIGMVSEYVMWLPGEVRKPVQVLSPISEQANCEFAALLDTLVTPFNDPPIIKIDTDKTIYRIGEVSMISFTLINSDVPRVFDSFLILRRPNGTLGLSGIGFTPDVDPDPCSLWIHWALSYPLSKGYRLEDFPMWALRTHDLPPGIYTWYYFMTVPNSYQIVARAKRTFWIMP